MLLISVRGFPAPTRRGYAASGRGRQSGSTGSPERPFERPRRRGRTRHATSSRLRVDLCPIETVTTRTRPPPGAQTRVRETAYPSPRVCPEDHPRSRPTPERSAHALSHSTAESSSEFAWRSMNSSLSARLAPSRIRQVTHLMWSQRSPAGCWLPISRSWRAPASQAMDAGTY